MPGRLEVRAWLASRALVLAALGLTWLLPWHDRASLLAWDAAWYRDIADLGYAGAPAGAVRYFPVWPLLGRGLAYLTGLPAGVLLVVVANVCALAYLGVARRLAVSEGHAGPVATAMPWVVGLAPAGMVLVMGYPEALFGILVGLVLIWCRGGAWWRCAAVALVAGALRPTGVTLCLPILIEACRGLRGAGAGNVGARVVATAAPAVGLGSYLVWSWRAYGDPWLPFQAQLGPDLRAGVLTSPAQTLSIAFGGLGEGWLDTALVPHLVWILVSLALLVLGVRRIPASFTAFSAVTLFLAVTALHFGSFERYACSALPLLLVVSLLLAERPRLRRRAGIAAAALLVAHAVITFTGWYVP